MKTSKLLLSIILLSNLLISQSIQGVVKITNTHEPLHNVQIVIENTFIGTISDKNGYFSIEDIPQNDFSLNFSHTGYKTEKVNISIDDLSLLTIYLVQSPISVEEIFVTGEKSIAYNTKNYSFNDAGNSPNDVGQFFKTISGASAVKKGGFAMDPSIRGFKMDQLNIQVDGGCKCWGGCPNRMDPPTSHIQSDDIERIEVIKGPFSVRWGPTMGGIINLVMKRPDLGSSFKISGNLNAGYESNGNSRKERITLKGGNKKVDFYFGGGEKVFGNYNTGGDNHVIPSAFTMRDYSLKIGVNPSIDNRFQISWRQSFANDVNYPALPMDATIDDTDILMLDYSGRNISKLISTISAKAYYNSVYHVMDNFERTNFKMVEAETIADAKTYGGRIEIGSQSFQSSKLYIGSDFYNHSKNGNRTRFVKTNPCNKEQHPNKEFIDKVWQNSAIQNIGIFADFNHIFNNQFSLNTGLRYDIVKSNIADPSVQFIENYGDETKFNDDNLSFTTSVRYEINSNFSSTISIGRGTRSSDITERYINHLPVGKSAHEHFGNPYLESEINDQIELSMNSNFGKQALIFNIFYSKLSNYIFAKVDSSMIRTYLPCNEPKFVKIFENIEDAYQYGYEIEFNGQLIETINFYTSIAYLFGQNNDLKEPLPEIAPFTFNYILKYNPKKVNGWIDLIGRTVLKQSRISNTYGESETDGYCLLGLAIGYHLNNINFRVDMQNIFDKKYYDHLSRNFSKNIAYSGIPYYEPGRNITFNIEIKI